MEPGVYDGIPEDHYHSSDGVSVSRLKRFAEAPAKARFGVQKETPALALGSLIHCAVLEPAELEHRYQVTDLDRRGTKAWDAAEAAAGGRELVKRADWDEALAIRDAVHKHPVARELLSGPLLVEQSMYWIDEETGLLCRGRTDGMRVDMRVLIDVKSTTDASPGGFARTVTDYFYDWQDAFYRAGINRSAGWTPEAFIFVAVEKEPPYLVGAYEVDPADLEAARDDLREQLAHYAECLRTDTWPGYSETLELVRLPAARRAYRLGAR